MNSWPPILGNRCVSLGRKQHFAEESNRNRAIVETQIGKIHTGTTTLTKQYFNKKFGSHNDRKLRMTNAAKSMIGTGRPPMTLPELQASRTMRSRHEAQAHEPRETPEQLLNRKQRAQAFESTFDRVLGTNPGCSRQLSDR
uniref:Uncharacterized protein n=1 Tax=Lotharella globosa TaxID=91324 RepID=A0A7S3ZIR6_9EUKA